MANPRYTDEGLRYRDGLDLGLDDNFIDPIQQQFPVTAPRDTSITGQITLDAFTADQNDLTLPDGHSFRIGTDGTNRTITGFANVKAGRIAYLHNAFGGANVLIANQNAGSTAEYRTITGTGASVTIQPDRSAIILYDGVTTRWRVIAFT
jgi:hypothetical protein